MLKISNSRPEDCNIQNYHHLLPKAKFNFSVKFNFSIKLHYLINNIMHFNVNYNIWLLTMSICLRLYHICLIVYHVCLMAYLICLMVYRICLTVFRICMIVYHICLIVYRVCMVIYHICLELVLAFIIKSIWNSFRIHYSLFSILYYFFIISFCRRNGIPHEDRISNFY